MESVKPVRPLAPYIGGKRNLAKRLTALIDATPHDSYLEPFVGMGGVFFRRQTRPKAEAINDISRHVATLFRILQRHYVAFLEMMRFQLTTRAEFERLLATAPDTLTDLERAARFLNLQRTSYGGKVAGRTFGTSPGLPARFDVTKLGPMLEDMHTRLSGVVVECLPWPVFVDRYDRPGALIYLDPPYRGNEADYGKDVFSKDDFAAMAEQLGRIQGRFILSINDRPEIRDLFAAFRIEAVETSYTLAGMDKARKVGELVITNLPRVGLQGPVKGA